MSAVRSSKPVTIFDTGIVVQAALTPTGVAERALQWTERDVIQVIVNDHLRWEYEYVLMRLIEEGEYPQLARPDVLETQLARVDATMVRVSNAPKQVTYARDPNDEQTVDLALYTQADFLVARDKDLLALNHDTLFRRICPYTHVVNPVEFVQEMERRFGRL